MEYEYECRCPKQNSEHKDVSKCDGLVVKCPTCGAANIILFRPKEDDMRECLVCRIGFSVYSAQMFTGKMVRKMRKKK
ncbi:MAG: hypothetical protein WCX79_01105 [Candidatus Paceibacterota bacterium]